MKVYGNKNIRVLFPKCEFVDNIQDAQLVYLESVEQAYVRIVSSSKYSANVKLKEKLYTVLEQMSKNQLLVLSGGYSALYAKRQGLSVLIAARGKMVSYDIVLSDYVYNVVGNQFTVIVPNNDPNILFLSKSIDHVGFDKNLVTVLDFGGECELAYFKNENEPNCLMMQFYPGFYPKAPIIPRLVSRIKKYIQ